MSEDGGSKSDRQAGQLKRQKGTTSPVSISPSARLDSMTKDRIDALERDKQELKIEISRLQAFVSEIAPRNARLEEALSNAESNNIVATILIGVGGFLVSYATFTGKAADKWANIAAGCLLAGIGLLTWQSFRRWRRR